MSSAPNLCLVNKPNELQISMRAHTLLFYAVDARSQPASPIRLNV